MAFFGISNWDDAYENGAHIPQSDRWPNAWHERATEFRRRTSDEVASEIDRPYGPAERNRFDLFLPRSPAGLVIYIHGGYWLRLEKGFWSHLAQGPLGHRFAVAIPSYTLCPAIRLTGIVDEIAAMIEAVAARVDGPIILVGHSAGGHLATSMVGEASPLSAGTLSRILNVVSLSGLHDLRPLMRTTMNAKLRLDQEEANRLSPALQLPKPGARVTCWIGSAERSEFQRQSALLANIWRGLGAETSCVVEPDRHHFDIMEGLSDPMHPLTRCALTFT